MSITDFLLARIAEDEALAREEDEDFADTTLLPNYDSEHQANWNTTRALAECAAKRAIVAGRVRIDRSANDDEWSMGFSDANYQAVQAIAAVYSDHPDYQEEWKP